MNKLVNKFCNLLMKSGKKARAYALFSESFTLFLRESNSKTAHPVQEWAHPKPVKPPQEKLRQANNEFLFHRKAYPKNVTLQDNPKKKSSQSGLGLSISCNTVNTAVDDMENILSVIVENVRPLIEIRKVRVARATYQVPAQISRLKGETLAVRWIIEYANKKKQKDKITLAQALAFELTSAHRKQGGPRQRRGELHKLAEANRSYIRYRWW